MLSALAALPAACDLLASYAATPLAAARNKAPGFQASFGVRKWVEGATVTVEYANAGACTLSAVDEPALAQGMLDLPRASVSVLNHAPPKFSLVLGPAPAAKAEAAAGGTGGGASRRLQSSAAASSRDPSSAAHRRWCRRWERRRVCRLLCAAPAHAAASNGQPERPAAAAVARQRCALAQPRAKLCFQNRMLLVSQVPREHSLAVGGHRLAVRRREVLKIPVHDRGVRGVPAFGAHQPVVDGLVDPIHSKLP